MTRLTGAAIVAAFAVAACGISPPAEADDARIARGRYLVGIAGCSDCHTPGGMMGAADMKRYLGGSDVGFSIPGVGVYVGQNLTPDKATDFLTLGPAGAGSGAGRGALTACV